MASSGVEKKIFEFSTETKTSTWSNFMSNSFFIRSLIHVWLVWIESSRRHMNWFVEMWLLWHQTRYATQWVNETSLITFEYFILACLNWTLDSGIYEYFSHQLSPHLFLFCVRNEIPQKNEDKRRWIQQKKNVCKAYDGCCRCRMVQCCLRNNSLSQTHSKRVRGAAINTETFNIWTLNYNRRRFFFFSFFFVDGMLNAFTSARS